MPYIGRAPTSTATKLEDADQDTKIQLEESSDEDTIRFDIAGAEDFTMSANSLNVLTGSVVALPDGAVGTPALTNTGDLNTGVYFPAADTVGVVAGGTEQFRFGSNPIPGGSKNLLINGDMRIKQRSTMPTTGTGYTLDGWEYGETGATVATITQDTDVPSGKGFSNSLKIVVATEDSSVAAGDYVILTQRIEGQNLQHLEYGHADAKSLTVSFWTKRPLTGTHCVAIYSQDATHRSYVREFTIASADTWEYFSLTFPGDASGNINDDSGAGIDLIFPLMTGSTFQISADTWSAGQDWATSSIVNDVGIADDIIYLTGVQLEVGDVATDFAHEELGTTLRKCQRYLHYQNRTSNSDDHIFAAGKCNSTTVAEFVFAHPVTMRSAPTMSVSAVDDLAIRHGNTQTICTNLVTLVSGANNACLTATVSSGLTAGEGALLYVHTNLDHIQWSAEL